jgi:hypothetical protein
MRWLPVLLLVGCSIADAHDQKRPDLDSWFNGLQSAGSGLCCHGREAKELDDSDWDTKDAHYRVRLNGDWYDVPDNAVVKERNLVGHALVWVYVHRYGEMPILTIRCFLPGTWS